MKMKRKLLTILLVLFVGVLFTFTTIANAETTDSTGDTSTTETTDTHSFSANLTSDKAEIKSGDSITVTLEITNINMGESGINTLEAQLDYDKDVFETIKNNQFQAQNNWSTTYNDEEGENEGKIVSMNLSEGIKEDTKIFTLTMKTKSDIKKDTTTKINLKDITSNDGQDNVNIGTKTAEIKIKGTDSDKPVEIIDDNNTIEEPKENSNTNTNTNTNTAKKEEDSNSTTMKTKLPMTGKGYLTIALIAIAIVALIILKNRADKYKGIK